jgi:uncharacterized protein (TIRG00374 family)
MKEAHAGMTRRRALTAVVGLLFGLVFLYLAFRDVSFGELLEGLKTMRPWYLAPGFLLIAAIQGVRAYRFGVILRPVRRVRFKDLWDVTNIWGALNMALPARLAEFARPYLLRQSGAAFSSVVGAVVVERLFDLMGILTLLAVVLWAAPEVPPHYAALGELMLGALVGMYGFTLLVLARKERALAFLDRVLSLAPERAAAFVSGAATRLIEGLGVMASATNAAVIFLCSVLIWTLFSLLTYLFLKAFAITVPFVGAIAVQVLLCFGVALPAAPGFVGTFHAAGRYGLALFGVAALPALSFATVYHAFSLASCFLLGAVSYRWGTYSFGVKALTADPAWSQTGEPS